MNTVFAIIIAVIASFTAERLWENRKLYRWHIRRFFQKKDTEEECLAKKKRLEEEYPEHIKVPSFEECMIDVFTSWGIDYHSLMPKEKSPSDNRNDDISE